MREWRQQNPRETVNAGGSQARAALAKSLDTALTPALVNRMIYGRMERTITVTFGASSG